MPTAPAERRQTLTITDGLPAGYAIVVTARHDKTDKVYTATAALMEDKGAYMTATYVIFGENPGHLRIAHMPVARFSLNGFEAFADHAFSAEVLTPARASLTALAKTKAAKKGLDV